MDLTLFVLFNSTNNVKSIKILFLPQIVIQLRKAVAMTGRFSYAIVLINAHHPLFA